MSIWINVPPFIIGVTNSVIVLKLLLESVVVVDNAKLIYKEFETSY